MNILYCDTETFSSTPLNNGVNAYSDADDFEVMIFTYAEDDGEPQIVDFTANETIPAHIARALRDTKIIKVWHNSGFDRTVVRKGLGIDMPPEAIHDTLVNALCHGLPGGLDKLGAIFNVASDQRKDKRGKELIHMFCKPQPKNTKLRRKTRDTHPLEWEQFRDYAKQDIPAMRTIYKKMPRWSFFDNPREFALWCLDQKINDRGVQIDVDFAEAAVCAVDAEKVRLKDRTEDNTLGLLASTTQRDKLLAFVMAAYGIDLPNTQAGTIERRIEDPGIPEPLRELLRIRLMAGSASVAKYKKILKVISPDGRLRAALQFAGAARTARWGGRLFQPQNLPRPDIEPELVEAFIRALLIGCEDLISDNVMKGLANALRGLIIAGPGKKLVAADLSNIEGRCLAWQAYETWKLDAYREYDAGTGPDLYYITAGRVLDKDPSKVTKAERQSAGKVPELACGYQGAVGAFGTMMQLYGLNLSEPQILKIVKDWRDANENIRSYWKDAENAVREAILNPGLVAHCRRVKIVRKGAWLKVELPSGRFLSYASPKVHPDGHISYWGLNSYTRKWEEIDTYGGKLVENWTQAIARDVMAHNMPAIEAAGYAIVLTVHDEVITEAPDDPSYTVERLCALLTAPPQWEGIEEFPLSASGFEAYRYKKEG